MAWLTSKTMITNLGLTMLSEAQSGSLPLTITRAEIGKTFSQTAELSSLTSLPTPVSGAVIGERSTDANGSKIKVVFNNASVTEAFPVCQIGVYATHPNINNGAEVLYLISQSESPAETMPIGSVSPLIVKYVLYVKHARANNVVITIDETYIPTASATELGGIKVGTGLSIDSNGVLSGSNQYVLPNASASELGGIKVGSGLSIDANGTLTAIGSVGFRNV